MLVSKMSFTGDSTGQSYRSSDLIAIGEGTSSKGNQRKWVTEDGKVFIKECFRYDNTVWRDDLVELIVSKYSKLCNDVNCVQYSRCTVDGRNAVSSENFLRAGEQFVSFERLRRNAHVTMSPYQKHSAHENFVTLRDILIKTTGLDLSLYLYKMALLDYIIGNEDRHYNNFGVIVNESTGYYRESPLFDFGLGMFEHDTVYRSMSFNDAVGTMSGKPFAGKSINVSKFLLENSELNHKLLPEFISLSDFEFPSKRAERLFVERNKQLCVEVR